MKWSSLIEIPKALGAPKLNLHLTQLTEMSRIVSTLLIKSVKLSINISMDCPLPMKALTKTNKHVSFICNTSRIQLRSQITLGIKLFMIQSFHEFHKNPGCLSSIKTFLGW